MHGAFLSGRSRFFPSTTCLLTGVTHPSIRTVPDRIPLYERGTWKKIVTFHFIRNHFNIAGPGSQGNLRRIDQFGFFRRCRRGRWGLFEKAASQILRCTWNAPIPEPGGTVRAEKASGAKEIFFWGCPGMRFKAPLPFHGMGEGFAVFSKRPQRPSTQHLNARNRHRRISVSQRPPGRFAPGWRDSRRP